MTFYLRYAAFCLSVLLSLSECQKKDPDPLDQLPPATQTGANTFGCLVNGQAWKPRGNDGYPNYTVSYDPSYRQGTLSVAASRLEQKTNTNQALGVWSDSLKSIGRYRLRSLGRHGAGFIDNKTRCTYYSVDPGTYCLGTLTITRLDLTAGIIAGTFDYTLALPGCDSVRITNGRFDYKL